MNAESMLLINNREPEIRELNALLKQGVGADNNLRAAVGNGGELNFAAFAFQFAGQPCNTNTEGTQPRIKVEAVLLRQNFCWPSVRLAGHWPRLALPPALRQRFYRSRHRPVLAAT